MHALPSISMGRMGHLLHQLEVSPHTVRQSRHLAQFGDQHYFLPCFLVHGDDHWLVHVTDCRLVLALEVLMIGGLRTVSIEHKRVLWRLLKIDIVHLVRALVVTGKDGDSDQCFLDLGAHVTSTPIFDISDEVEH